MLVLYPIVVFGVVVSSRAVDYCTVTCDGLPHTMCQYTSGGGKGCKGYKGGLTSTEQGLLLSLHNENRQRVAQGQESRGPQPPASDMAELTWDDELAEVAQRWADQCKISGHDQCRSKGDGSWVGQNIASGFGPYTREKIIEIAVQAWYNEVELVPPTMAKRFDPGNLFLKIGHYTQLVWANTSRLGCGLSLLRGEEIATYRVVCNYWPTGNYNGMPLYREGKSCSACPPGGACSPTYPGLCRL